MGSAQKEPDMANRTMCAMALLLVVAGGCTPEQFGLGMFQSSGPGADRVVAASLETVSQSTKTGLERLGMTVAVAPQGEDVRLAVRTSVGDQFAVVLTRVKMPDGERTRVRIDGGTGAHHDSVFRILSDVETTNKR
jgi:hypothetical protein